LIGSAFIGISIITLKFSGIFLPGLTRLRLICTPNKNKKRIDLSHPIAVLATSE
jgi:hypothetical protein